MALSADQRSLLAGYLSASQDPDIADAYARRDDTTVAELLKQPSDRVVWRDRLTEDELIFGGEKTSWEWSAFDLISNGRQYLWTRIWQRNNIDPSQERTRAALTAVFAGDDDVLVRQREHIDAMCIRVATIGEAIYLADGDKATPVSTIVTGAATIEDIGRGIETAKQAALLSDLGAVSEEIANVR
jgi:hypothetical protein